MPTLRRMDAWQPILTALQSIEIRAGTKEIRDVPAELHRWNSREYFESATPEDVTKWLADEVGPNEFDSDGRTPLHHAAVHGRGDLVETLLKAGAAQLADEFGWTPLHCADAAPDEPGAISPLLDAGADVVARTRRGITPLHFAVIHRTVDSVRLLLETGSDPRSVDGAGRTPEFCGAEPGHVETAAIIPGWRESIRKGRV